MLLASCFMLHENWDKSWLGELIAVFYTDFEVVS